MRAHTFLEVYWARLAHNWEVIQKLAPQSQIMPMIKANAYGHGLVAIGQFLSEELKAKALGVATLGEAEAVSHLNKVYVFSDTLVSDREYHARYSGHNIIPVIHDMKSLEMFLNDRCFKHLPLVIKLNTGMNRLGLPESEWESAALEIVKSGRKNIHHLMTHFARSFNEIKAGDTTHQQADLFKKALSLFKSHGISVDETSLANSGAIEQRFATNETWVRPGLMLYGPPSAKEQTKMVSSLVTHVMNVFEVKKGMSIGYGESLAPHDGTIAVLPIGYGDGYPTQSSGFELSVNGMNAKVFGRVNMDMTFLLFGHDSQNKIKLNDEVRFWNENPQELLSWAEHMKTHAYQALCGVSSRVPRLYRLG
ncbi:MAG: alanine racemase [Bacteriovoracaceae bacterium]|nr:alanine racemase [Bacteriovoracaceae bacterium]